MKLIDIVKKRCSVRDYSSRPVEKEKLEYILEAARLAPSACNHQPWRFVVIQDDKLLQKLQGCYEKDWFKTAPLCIVICGDHETSWKRKYDGKDHCDIDIAIATDHLILAATELGLGTCWVCAFDPASCREALQLPDALEPIVMVAVGYPQNEDVWKTTVKKRKNADEVIIYK